MLKLDLQFFASGEFVPDIEYKPVPDNFFLYNDEYIYFVAGDTLTLHCAGKKMKSDLQVFFSSDGTITYNGTEIAVTAGQTITRHCSGKKMKSDIVIAVPEAVNTYNITTTLSGCYGYSTNPTEIDEGESVTLQFAPNDGCALPVSVSVTGAEYQWIYSSGQLIISNPTGAVYISISCAAIEAPDWVEGSAPQITFTCEGVRYTAEEGMTFKQWINTSYNTGGYKVCTGTMAGEDCDFVHAVNSYYGEGVLASDTGGIAYNETVIADGAVYTAENGFMHDVTEKPAPDIVSEE